MPSSIPRIRSFLIFSATGLVADLALAGQAQSARAATATITSAYREDHTPIWEGEKSREDYPLRVSIKPGVVLEEEEWLDARELGPTLEYVRKWPPESWPLAFQGNMHRVRVQNC